MSVNGKGILQADKKATLNHGPETRQHLYDVIYEKFPDYLCVWDISRADTSNMIMEEVLTKILRGSATICRMEETASSSYPILSIIFHLDYYKHEDNYTVLGFPKRLQKTWKNIIAAYPRH